MIDGARFVWRVTHEHHVRADAPPGEGRCREVLTIAGDGRHAGRLRLEFTDGPTRNAGYPQAGVVWRSDGSGAEVNLNLPRVARAAVEEAMADGWRPDGPGRVIDGWALLDRLAARAAARATWAR